MAYGDGYAGGYGLPLMTTLFTAPLFSEKWGDEKGHDSQWSLWRFYEPVVSYVQSVIIVSGVVIPTAAEGTRTLTAAELASADVGTGENGKAIFRGKLTHEVSTAEGVLLSAAGYTVT